MGISHTDLFDVETNQLASLAKVLGHPARLAILRHLHLAKACINGDLVEEIGLAQATISQHLKELKNAGLIQGNIEGTRVNYCIHSENWARVASLFAHFFAEYENPNSCC